MKKHFNLLALVLFSVIVLCNSVMAQSFEGVIEFKRATSLDTTDYIYYIKGNMVRIDEIASDKSIAGIMLVDIKNNKSQSLSPDRKLFMDVEPKSNKAPLIKDAKAVKGKNTKTIAGYKCEEWTVTHNAQNTKVTYYLAKDDFEFFQGLLSTLGRKDKVSTFYQQIPDTKGFFSFYAQEADLNGTPRTTLEVVKVTRKAVDKSLFEIPADYKKFEK